MNIKIDGKKFPVFDYDDDNTILERYCLGYHDELSLPSFFRISDKDFVLKENLSLQIENVMDYIKDVKQKDLSNENLIKDILIKYPRLRKREIGFLWILTHPKDDLNIEYFKNLDRSAFLSSEKAKRSVEDFKKEIKKIRDKNTALVKQDADIHEKLSKTDSVTPEPFIIQEATILTVVDLPHEESLLEVFDSMTVSRDIPFITILTNKKRFYKVYTHTIPPDQWLEEEMEEGIYFKILNPPISKITAKKTLVENLYADCFWSKENVLRFTFKVRGKKDEDEMKAKIFSAFGERLKYEILSSKQVGIKGKFVVKDFQIERYIFADLVATNNLFKRFLFFDEGGSDKKIKSVLTKTRLFVHYLPSVKEGSKTNLITITPTFENGKESLVIRVSGAENYQQVNAVLNVFSKLFGLYKKLAPEIKKIYEEIIPSLREKKTEKKKEIVVDKKTKKRLAALRAVDSDMFRERYGDQCQREGQPLIVSKEEAEEAVQKFKKQGVPNPTHKIMFFNGNYFVCDPREPDDKQAKPHIWPGLKVNKPSNKLKGAALENATDFAKKHPLLPCCYTMDQYTKKASQLRLYLENQKSNEKVHVKESKGAEHVLGPNRIVPEGRFGEMPFNWEKIFRHLNLEKARKGKQEFYPILRYGVLDSPDSFIHCLERAFNDSYVSLSMEKKKESVMRIRRQLSEKSFEIAKQEMFDYTDDSIKNILTDEERYIDSDLFISIFERHYKCNIFLYCVNSENPSGFAVTPRYSQAYLSKKVKEDKPYVFIVKFETGGTYPYQCEIVSSMDIEGGKVKNVDFVFDSSSSISQTAVELFYSSNEVFIVNPQGYKVYKPISI